jgi:hypothetical protein
MSKLIVISTLLLASQSFATADSEQYFSGCLVYRNTFKTLPATGFWQSLAQYVGYYSGDRAVAAMRTTVGTGTLYYINDGNYKSYTENKKPVQLYIGSTNQYYSFVLGKDMPAIDADKGATNSVVTHLNQTATIAGYPCHSLQIAGNGTTTTYFYSSKIRVNPASFAKHRYGSWHTYLQASKGALPLRFIVRNSSQGYEWTSEVTSVRSIPLPDSEFTISSLPR